MGAKQSSNLDNIDISSYLTQEKADEVYQVKPPSDDEFVLKSYADDTYKFPEDYVNRNELSAYLLEDKAKKIFQELPPKGDQFVLKSYTDQLLKLTSNYATMTELNKYITQDLASSLYQPKDPNGNLTANTVWNKGSDFLLGVNDGRGNFSNNMPGGRALVKGDNTQLVMNFAGDFGGGVRIDGGRGLTLAQGPIIANTPGTQSVIQNLNISNGFNAPKANSSFYGVILDAGGITSRGNIVAINNNNQIINEGDHNFSNSMNFQKRRPAGVKNGNELGYITFEGTDINNNMRRGSFIYSTAEGDFTSTSNPANIRFLTTSPGTTSSIDRMIITSNGNIVIPNKGSIVIPDSGGAYGAGNGSYIYNDNQTLRIEMRNGGDGKIELRAGTKMLSFDKDGKLCFAPGKCITENTPGINWSS